MRRLLLVFIILQSLNGCGPSTTIDSSDQTDIDPEQQARAFLLADDFAAAAEEYLRLAGKNKNKSIEYKLKAAEAYIDGDNLEHASHILENLNQDNVSPSQLAFKNILYAQIALLENNPDTALELLNIDLPDNTSRSLNAAYHETRALALEQNKKFIDVINERILLNDFLDIQEDKNNNADFLWKIILKMDLEEINNIRLSSNEQIASWMELAIINKTMIQNKRNMETAIDAWSRHYPEHPALYRIVPGMNILAGQLNILPNQIALLLPFTAKFRDASTAIREGFIAAWYESTSTKPVIKIYDADAQNIIEEYQLAINEGADFIIGPLEKEAVSILIENNQISVRTMVLNNYDKNPVYMNDSQNNLVIPSLIQFALSPEDEAIQVADRAWFDGHANALIITPDTQWGERIFNAFNTQWEQLGGKTLEHIRLDPNSQDFATPIKNILNVDNSDNRAKILKSRLNRKLHTEFRRRQDVDIIFIATAPVIGRQLLPQLRFYRADDIDVYSISHIYTGILNSQADSDMNNLIFADMPWILDPEYEYSPIQNTLNNSINQNKSNYRRLYALGVDAYRIISQLGTLANKSGEAYTGATGHLKLTNDGRIHRRLIWAQFKNGEPKLIDTETIH